MKVNPGSQVAEKPVSRPSPWPMPGANALLDYWVDAWHGRMCILDATGRASLPDRYCNCGAKPSVPVSSFLGRAKRAKAPGLCGPSLLPHVVVGFHDAGFGIFAISDCSLARREPIFGLWLACHHRGVRWMPRRALRRSLHSAEIQAATM